MLHITKDITIWTSGTTLAYLLRTVHQSAQASTRLNIITPSLLYLECLSQLLAIPVNVLWATTFQREMDRVSSPGLRMLIQRSQAFQLALCPQCLTETRTLARGLVLPHITLCLQHHLILQKSCMCGTKLQLFSQQARPFACSDCDLDWKNLPPVTASPERLLLEQQLLSCYDLFFTHGTPKLVRNILTLIAEYDQKPSPPINNKKYVGSVAPKIPRGRLVLGDVVPSMVRLGITPYEILTRSGHVTEGISIIG